MKEVIIDGERYVSADWAIGVLANSLKASRLTSSAIAGHLDTICPGVAQVITASKPPEQTEPTVKSVYDKEFSELKSPEGWEFTGQFREPTERDCGWLEPGRLAFTRWEGQILHEPCLILRRKPAP